MLSIFMEDGKELRIRFSDIKISDSEIRVICFGSLVFRAKLEYVKYFFVVEEVEING